MRASERNILRQRLLRTIRSVRRRWRLKRLLRGAVIVAAVGLAVFLLSSWVIDHYRFDPGAVLASRILTYVVIAVLAFVYLLRPLIARAPDERVALYLEEHEPSLHAAMLSAIELKESGAFTDDAPEAVSPQLAERVIETAIERCRSIRYGHRIERSSLRRSSGVLAGVATAGLAVVLLDPAFLRHGGPVLLRPWRAAVEANPYSIQVTPGDADLARGADQKVSARLVGFESGVVEIGVRRGDATEWERWSMNPDPDNGDYLFLLFDLDEKTEYFVEASGVRSSVYTIDVSDLPYVDHIDLEYRFPEYTGLPPEAVEDAGDIVALRGTEVRLSITPTMESPSGFLAIEEQEPIPLEPGTDGRFHATLTVDREAFYTVELEAWNGRVVQASPEYAISVLRDQLPTVHFSKPGGDARATSIEEFYTEVEAEDDYGIRSVELVFSVNGGEEQTISLYRGGRKQVSAGHTFYMEEYGLVPGDFVSYYARVRDTDRVDGPHIATTDIYFVEIRPFEQNYRQADQGGQPGAGSPESALSQRQREIVAATFKLIRDRQTFTPKEYSENLATLALVQARLREQVESLLERIRNRGASADEGFMAIVEALPIAIEEMAAATGELENEQPGTALVPEQKALQQLLRAEAAFRDVQVSFNQQPGGGGQGPNAEDLADLFELELDKLQNQYESVQRGQQQQQEAEVDEAMQRLEELARRQQQANERMRRGLQQPGQGGGGSASQQQLAEETEELARQLERLARERSSPDLMRSARDLRDAADAMRRSQANGGESGLASGLSALRRLQEARRLLESGQSEQVEAGIQNALDQTRRLQQQEARLQRDVERLAGSDPDSEPMNRLLERKAAMSAEVSELERELDQLATRARAEERDASRLLRAAAQSIRQNRLEEKIRYSMGVVQSGDEEYARSFEEEIASNIDELEGRVADAAEALGESDGEQLAASLESARELVRGLESLEERVGERAGSRRLGDPQQGQQGEQGQQGQQGQGEGQQGEGQQGQQGQQGQGEQQSGQRGAAIAGPGGGRGGPVSGLGAEDTRQFRREFRERRAEAEALRQELSRLGVDVSQMAEVIAGLRALDDQRVYGDAEEIARLQSSVIRGLKEFEYALRRQLDAGEEQLFLSGSDEVPEGYREMVEEYYKALAGGSSR